MTDHPQPLIAAEPKGWTISHRADPDCLPIADRHYNRQKPGTPQFVAPGRCVVLKRRGAVWVTSWPFAEYVKHAWAGAWVNSMFRKECDGLASDFIREAVAATRFVWPDVPPLGLVSFIDPNEVAPRKVRGRLAIGESYFEAGFKHVGYTKAGLWVMQLLPEDMPGPVAPLSAGARSRPSRQGARAAEVDVLRAELARLNVQV